MITALAKNITLASLLTGIYINAYAHTHHETSSIGKPVAATKKTKIIKVTASDDMRFTFSEKPEPREGEIITFEVTNTGKVAHEFSIGDEEEQKEHQKMMRAMPGMVHEDGNTITINPGETKKLTWKFQSSSKHEVVFSCNIPGHFEAGMYMKTNVAKI
ncbi:cupredoxin domain-containing protein [Legionella sp. WA2022007384]